MPSPRGLRVVAREQIHVEQKSWTPPGADYIRCVAAGESKGAPVRAPVYNAGVRQKTGLLLTDRFTEAMALAARLHAPQWRKGTGIPYISHLLGVTSIAIDYGANEDEAIAALLHDAIEDAPPDLGADW